MYYIAVCRPAIEEVGEGVGGLGGEEERENGSDDTHREEKPRER